MFDLVSCGKLRNSLVVYPKLMSTKKNFGTTEKRLQRDGCKLFVKSVQTLIPTFPLENVSYSLVILDVSFFESIVYCVIEFLYIYIYRIFSVVILSRSRYCEHRFER